MRRQGSGLYGRYHLFLVKYSSCDSSSDFEAIYSINYESHCTDQTTCVIAIKSDDNDLSDNLGTHIVPVKKEIFYE